MQPHKQTVQNGSRARLATLFGASLLALGCSPPLAPADDGPDDGEVPDVPADLPAEPIEYAGILYGLNYNAEPSRFILCDTGEFIEWSFPTSRIEEVHEGSCYGVYHRVRGQLDRDFEPPRLIIDEIVESRWCEPDDCEDALCTPNLDSCDQENEVTFSCDPLLDTCGSDRCIAERFYATEDAGWMLYVCRDIDSEGVAGDPCAYTDKPEGEIDDCADGYRCWNPDGDTTAPGTCVAYCDVEAELGPICDGACVPCSATERGLCMSGCVGEDCRVDDFC
jgi:hypothetical protein